MARIKAWSLQVTPWFMLYKGVRTSTPGQQQGGRKEAGERTQQETRWRKARQVIKCPDRGAGGA